MTSITFGSCDESLIRATPLPRRSFLRLGISCALAGGSSRVGAAGLPLLPRVNGAINVQPARLLDPQTSGGPLISPELVALQMRAVYELGFGRIRVTLPFGRFGPDFLGAIPYVRAARALGMDVLGVMSDFTGFDLAQALAAQATRDEVVETYLRVFGGSIEVVSPAVGRRGELALQVLNEPTHFLGLTPREYVFEILRHVWGAVKSRRPSVRVAAAAPIGNVSGLPRLRELFESGHESYCDRVAFHIYSRRLLPHLSGLSERFVWVTESGTAGTENHLDWHTEVFDEIRASLPKVLRVYWFDLFDPEPGRFRLIGIERSAGALRACVRLSVTCT